MPGTAKPSKDCYRCRQRRIKCDLGQPECQRCLQRGQPCPGYRDELGLVFRNENQESYPVSAARDGRKANTGSSRVLPSHSVPSITSTTALSDITTHISLFDKIIHGYEPLPQSMLGSWDEYAMPLVISLFSAPTKHGERFFGFMDFFPEMVTKATDTSSLILCCKAVALMYFNNRFIATEENTNRRAIAYGQALSATNAALSDPDLSVRDETFVSIWLLSVYETLCGANMSLHCTGRPPTWNMHILGLTSLMRMRSRPQFLSGSGRRFFWMVMGVVESRSLAAGIECPTEVFSWLQEHIADFVPEELDMHHALVHGYHASVLCAKIRKIIDAEELQEFESILSVVEEARKLGRETEASLAQDPLTRHLHLRQAHIHNFHRAVRIHIQYSILELLQSDLARSNPELTPQFLEKQQNLSISTVRALTQNTLATVSYILGPQGLAHTVASENEEEPERSRCWADGMRLLWPLRVIGSREVVSKDQRKVVEETLHRLNAELCMRAAIVPYAIPRKMQLQEPAQAKAPRRSKGCRTCRRRKVKCDEEKPNCQRCRTTRFDCEGYESPFVNVDPVRGFNLDQEYIGRVDEST